MGLFQKSGQVDVEESRNMPQVEQTDVSQVDRLLEQHRRRDHTPGDAVPSGPHVPPVLRRRDAVRRKRV